jgi:putative Ca2+/H+ antiporter (TMEM165/GDT1 family)
VSFAVAASVFPIIFLGELPDKTMFASLVLASRGRPLAVWVGAAMAFVIHVAIAVTIGVVLFHVVPHRVLEGIVAAAFFLGAGYSFHIRNEVEETAEVTAVGSPVRTALTALGVIFVAEWGDLTQILTANLAARYHSVIAVAAGSIVALWAVAALAVISGSSLLKVLSVRTLRLVTAVILVALGAYSLAGTF